MAERKQSRKPESLPEKGMPANVDAERFVLGSILLDDTQFIQTAALLKSDDFSLEKHRRIFRRMGELQERGERIDRVTVADMLMRFNELEACDGLSYLVSLDEGLPRIPNIESYVRIVKDKATLRRVIFASQNMMNRCLLGEDSPIDILSGARETLLNIGSDESDDGPETPAQIIERLPGGMNRLLGPPDQGLATGFLKYDELTGGLHPDELTILAARPSMGKTALAINLAQYAAVDLGKTVMVFSLEMSKRALLNRMICGAARVDSQRVRAGYTNAEERHRLADAAYRLTESQLFIDDKSAATTTDLHARIRRQMAKGPVDLVVVDYLQLMSAGRKYESKNQEVSEISRGLKLLTKEIHAPVIALSQLNREVEKRKGNFRPQLSDLRESGAIEQDADVVAFIFREEVYFKDRPEARGKAELIIGKQRNGPIGTANLVFLHNLTRFENRAEDRGEFDAPPLLEHEYGA